MSPSKLPSDLVSMTRAAIVLGVSVATISRWTRSKRIRAYRIGARWKYSLADLANAVEVSEPESGPLTEKGPPTHQAAIAELRGSGYTV